MPDEKELAEASKKKGCGYWATVIMFLIVVLFLLLIFWPTNPIDKPDIKSQEGILKDRLKGSIVVDDAEYVISGYEFRFALGRRKAPPDVVFIVVNLKVRNISTEPKSLHESMVRLLLNSGSMENDVHGALTDLYLQEKGKQTPWGEWIGSGKTKNVSAVYITSLANNDQVLRLYSFNWTSNDFKEIPLKLDMEKARKESREFRNRKRVRPGPKDPDA